MNKLFVAIASVMFAGYGLAQVAILPSSFSTKEMQEGAKAFQKINSGKQLSARESIKASEFAGYVGGHIDAKTDGPNPEATLAECLRTKPRAVIVGRTASIIADPNNKAVGSVRFDVGLAVIMSCKDEYWLPKNSAADTNQWSKFGENTRLTAYFQKETASAGRTPLLWVLFDYKAEQESERSGKRYRSEKAKQEIDCAQSRSRTVFFTWHEANMGEGPVIYTGRTTLPWEPNSPGGIAAALAAQVCAKN